MTRNLKKYFNVSAKVAVGAFAFALLLEIGLRIVPALIPERLLAEFHLEVRSEIAQRRGLPTLAETVLIHRDDTGPELRIPKPFTKRNWPNREPGTVDSTQVDEMGFCNPEGHAYGEPAIDLISLGDSLIWCTAIDPKDTWTSKLGALTGFSTYSLAAIGTGTHEHVQILKQFGIQKSPRFVIMNVFEGNDLQDAVSYEYFVAENNDRGSAGRPSGATHPAQYGPCRIFQDIKQNLVGRYSYASNVLLVLVQDSCDTVSNRVTPESVLPNETGDTKKGFGYRVVYPDLSPVLTIEYNPRKVGADERIYAERLRSKNVDLEIFSGPLRSFVELSQRHGFVPVVVYTPAAYTAYEANVVFDDPALADLMPWFSRQQRDYFEDQGNALGYVFLDLTPVLQRAVESTEGINDLLYFRSNLHLTQRGHTVVADAIAGALRSIDGGLDSEKIHHP